MKETDRISKLFEDLYNGHPWIDVTLLPNLKKLTAKQASKRIYSDWNTIWEIVNHIISWRETVLLRLQGKNIKSPSHNYFTDVEDTSAAAWKITLERLELSQQLWLAFLKNFNENNFDTIYRANKLTYYEHIHGILQHDAYHLGQIVIMMKKVRK
ncbi:MAG TPA: DinB family protein [Saprospiraceae bacterium]|nr:DinB family protein [Saprospiraceae bacterium]